MELKFKANVRKSNDRVSIVTVPKWMTENSYVKIGKKYEFVIRELPDAVSGISPPSLAFGSQFGSQIEVIA